MKIIQYILVTLLCVTKNLLMAQNIYLGGDASGFYTSSYTQVSPSIFSGGFSDGFGSSTFNLSSPGIFGGGSGDGFVRGNFQDISLPILLVSFKGTYKVEKEHVILQWTTATEQSNNYFEIQHFTGDNEPETIGMVEGNGTTTTLHNYQFEHQNMRKGNNHYLLKQFDFDGKNSSSKIITVKVIDGMTEKFSVFPIPARNNLTISSRHTDDPYSIKIYSLDGKEVSHLSRVLLRGNTDIGISQLEEGIYFISIDNGYEQWKSKFIIDK